MEDKFEQSYEMLGFFEFCWQLRKSTLIFIDLPIPKKSFFIQYSFIGSQAVLKATNSHQIPP